MPITSQERKEPKDRIDQLLDNIQPASLEDRVVTSKDTRYRPISPLVEKRKIIETRPIGRVAEFTTDTTVTGPKLKENVPDEIVEVKPEEKAVDKKSLINPESNHDRVMEALDDKNKISINEVNPVIEKPKDVINTADLKDEIPKMEINDSRITVNEVKDVNVDERDTKKEEKSEPSASSPDDATKFASSLPQKTDVSVEPAPVDTLGELNDAGEKREVQEATAVEAKDDVESNDMAKLDALLTASRKEKEERQIMTNELPKDTSPPAELVSADISVGEKPVEKKQEGPVQLPPLSQKNDVLPGVPVASIEEPKMENNPELATIEDNAIKSDTAELKKVEDEIENIPANKPTNESEKAEQLDKEASSTKVETVIPPATEAVATSATDEARQPTVEEAAAQKVEEATKPVQDITPVQPEHDKFWRQENQISAESQKPAEAKNPGFWARLFGGKDVDKAPTKALYDETLNHVDENDIDAAKVKALMDKKEELNKKDIKPPEELKEAA